MSDTKKISPTLDALQEFLEKARRRLSDEVPDYADFDDMHEYAPEEHFLEDTTDEDEDDLAARWLRDNDPKRKKRRRGEDEEDEDSDDLMEDELSFDEPEDSDDYEDDYSDSSFDDEESEGDRWLKEHDAGTVDESDFEPSTPPTPSKPSTSSTPQEPKQAPTPIIRRKAKPAEEGKDPFKERKKKIQGMTPEEVKAAWENHELDQTDLIIAIQLGKIKAPGMDDDGEEFDNFLNSGRKSPEDEPDDNVLMQPTREELREMRQYTIPWERHQRNRERLEARPEVNPIKHHQGRIIEAANLSAADRAKAYEEFKQTPEYQNANRIQRLRLDAKFNADWLAKNPDHTKKALRAHHAAHHKGLQARELFEQAKDAKVRHILGGGMQDNSFGLEEGMQHAGSSRDEDSAPTGISMDRAAQFAISNRDFLEQYRQNYEKRAKKFNTEADLDTYNDEARADALAVLGDHPALKYPDKKAKVDEFVKRYHPLIGKAARITAAKLGLSDKLKNGEIDLGLLTEAGTHALYYAINDYDHDHPSKAQFTTHLMRKMQGLMQEALKTQLDAVPKDMVAGAKQFDKQKALENAAPIKVLDKDMNFRHWASPDGKTILSTDPNWKPPAKQSATPTPPPAPEPKPATQPAAPTPVIRRKAADLAATHGGDIHDRFKRVTALRVPKVPKMTDNDEEDY